MDWLDDVRARSRRNNQILFGKDDAYLQNLQTMLRGQSHKVVTLWALALAAESVAALRETYPAERRPAAALTAARDWAAGAIPMRIAQRKIMDCHAFARELDCQADIALCHAVGQACAVVHTAGHAIGYPMYDLTAIVRRFGLEHCREPVEQRRQAYIDQLQAWAQRAVGAGPWAAFMER